MKINDLYKKYIRGLTIKVLLITEENYMPYMRPPLSKDLWMTEDEELVKQLRFKQYNGKERRFKVIN